MRRIVVDSALKRELDKEGRKDPLVQEPFQEGDEIAQCACCNSWQLWQSWEALGGKCACGYQPGVKIRRPRFVATAVAIAAIILTTIAALLFFYDEQSYQRGRGNVESLNAYLRNCKLCLRKTQAEKDITDLQLAATVPTQPQIPIPQIPPQEPRVPQESPFFQFRVCNSGCAPISVALSYYDNGRWITRGWWNVEGNQCTSLGSFNKGLFYYYAKTRYGDLEWRGNYGLCVEFPGPFLRVNRPGVCPRGTEVRQFSSLYIQSDTNTVPLQGPCE